MVLMPDYWASTITHRKGVEVTSVYAQKRIIIRDTCNQSRVELV